MIARPSHRCFASPLSAAAVLAASLVVGASTSGCAADTLSPLPGATTSSSSSGTGGASSAKPIDTPEGQWTWVDFPESRCIDGSPTGIAIDRTRETDDVLVYFEGGGACFNAASCATAANTDGYGAAKFESERAMVTSMPIMGRAAAAPFRDMTHVFIPYCTGDLHGGDNDVEVGGKMRQFHGHANVAAYVARLRATFPRARRVVVAGSSAGGFGSLLNYDPIARAFGDGVDTSLIDDSGPVFSDRFLPVCFQKRLFDTFGFAHTLPAGCKECTPADGAFATPTLRYLLDHYADRRLSIVSSTEDATIRLFLSFSRDDCAEVDGFPGDYPADRYTAGLLDLRDAVLAGHPGFKVFLFDGTNGQDPTKHVWLTDDLHEEASHDVRLDAFVERQIGGSGSWASVPSY